MSNYRDVFFENGTEPRRARPACPSSSRRWPFRGPARTSSQSSPSHHSSAFLAPRHCAKMRFRVVIFAVHLTPYTALHLRNRANLAVLLLHFAQPSLVMPRLIIAFISCAKCRSHPNPSSTPTDCPSPSCTRYFEPRDIRKISRRRPLKYPVSLLWDRQI